MCVAPQGSVVDFYWLVSLMFCFNMKTVMLVFLMRPEYINSPELTTV